MISVLSSIIVSVRPFSSTVDGLVFEPFSSKGSRHPLFPFSNYASQKMFEHRGTLRVRRKNAATGPRQAWRDPAHSIVLTVKCFKVLLDIPLITDNISNGYS
ncbi:unnamed protein product [Leptidea sinapis]|uniref:Uncharacterized protein n=1 Tax=Leptidea sinapis TaxID=189913 RepID=A0A5E4QXG0_9NEOP|nr:unnamed protein product [Leptidea sinapis]